MAAPENSLRDTGDLLAEHEAAGGADPAPDAAIVDPTDPEYVEPYAGARPVAPAEQGEG